MSLVEVSIVAFRTDTAELAGVLDVLARCAEVGCVYVVDNGRDEEVRNVCAAYDFVEYLANANVGYGAGHNKAIALSLARHRAPYHLVINSDVVFSPRDLSRLLGCMQADAGIGLLHPRIIGLDGIDQYTARLIPAPFDLILRRFLPKGLFVGRRSRYLLKAGAEQGGVRDVGYVQGSFMLMRKEALREVGAFDPRFFMYPEDIDLSRRMHGSWRVAQCLDVTVTHAHAAASYHSPRMLGIHIFNMVRYFNKWGWINDHGRKEINDTVMGK